MIVAATRSRIRLAGAPLTTFNVFNNQVDGICAVVAAGTIRDSLDTTHNLDGGSKPEIVASDTSSSAERIVGNFRRLGYKS